MTLELTLESYVVNADLVRLKTSASLYTALQVGGIQTVNAESGETRLP